MRVALLGVLGGPGVEFGRLGRVARLLEVFGGQAQEVACARAAPLGQVRQPSRDLGMAFRFCRLSTVS